MLPQRLLCLLLCSGIGAAPLRRHQGSRNGPHNEASESNVLSMSWPPQIASRVAAFLPLSPEPAKLQGALRQSSVRKSSALNGHLRTQESRRNVEEGLKKNWYGLKCGVRTDVKDLRSNQNRRRRSEPLLQAPAALPVTLAQERDRRFPLIFNSSNYEEEDYFLPHTPDTSSGNRRSRPKQMKNPFYPLTAASYGAWAVLLMAAVIFSVGIIGNVALMCIVCHNYYMRSISNSLLANLALWDFIVVFFCLPLVVFHELTKNWLLGAFSCRIVPYLECWMVNVSLFHSASGVLTLDGCKNPSYTSVGSYTFLQVASLGVTTFTLCALCIDRFRAATNVKMYYEMIENWASTTAKLAVIWVGALLLALPELLIRQLVTEDGEPPNVTPCERCAVQISTELPDTLYVLGLTYDSARLWWYFGCYFCLPTLFTICSSLVTARKIRHAERACVQGTKKQIQLESQMNCAVVALAILYGFCIIPENICNIITMYMAAGIPRETLDILHLVSQLLLFCKSSVTPVLLFCLCQPFTRAFLDCCCCCCEECSPPHNREVENECPTAELELSPFSTIHREPSTSAAYSALGTHC